MVRTWLVRLLVCLGCVSCTSHSTETLPYFTATTISGDTFDTQRLRGKITIINIWATWCGDCIREIPTLTGLAQKYEQDSTVVFLAITDESKSKVEHFLQQRTFPYQHITDAVELKNRLHTGIIKTIPLTIVVDQDLNIVMRHTGNIDKLNTPLEAVLTQLKKERWH